MTFWQPVSGCGAGCRSGPDRPVSHGLAVLRVVTLRAVLLTGLLIVAIGRGAAVRGLARAVLAALGVRLRWHGPAPRPGSLLVANHVSWLDVVALLAVGAARPVPKREVRGWPGAGGAGRRQLRLHGGRLPRRRHALVVGAPGGGPAAADRDARRRPGLRPVPDANRRRLAQAAQASVCLTPAALDLAA